MDTTVKNRAADTEHSLSAVDKESKQGFWAVIVIMLGFTFFFTINDSRWEFGDWT